MLHSPQNGSLQVSATTEPTPAPLETRCYVTWPDSLGILHCRAKLNCDVDLADAKEIIQLFGAMAGGTKRPVLVNMTGTRSMSRDARRHFASAETAEVESAAALIVNSPLAKAMGNFFMGLNKPIMPTRLFTTEAEAMTWLRGFVP